MKILTQAMSTIQKRSEGLINFVNKYRDISKIPKPNFQTVKVSELFYRIRLLAEAAIADKNIHISVSTKSGIIRRSLSIPI